MDSVEPSSHDPSSAYITILRYQLGDWSPYIYKTKNYGKSWELIVDGIPHDFPVRVVREDPLKKGLLFAGTEFGIFVSQNDGKNWVKFQKNLPITPVTDLKIHRDDLVLSTMGRSFWVMDDINFLRSDLDGSKPKVVNPSEAIRYQYNIPDIEINDYLQAGVFIDYYLDSDKYQNVLISILDEKGKIIDSFNSISSEAKESTNYNMQLSDFSSNASYKVTTKKGFNRFRWNLRHRGIYDDDEEKNILGPFVKPGKYVVEVTLDNTNKISTEFSVEKDPNTEISQDVFIEVEQFQLKLINKIREATRILNEIKSLKLSKNLKKNKLQGLRSNFRKIRN